MNDAMRTDAPVDPDHDFEDEGTPPPDPPTDPDNDYPSPPPPFAESNGR